MRIVKRPYLRKGRLILGSGKKTFIKSGRLILGNGKTLRGGFLGPTAAALAPMAINGLAKIFGGGRKKNVRKELLLKDLNNCQKYHTNRKQRG